MIARIAPSFHNPPRFPLTCVFSEQCFCFWSKHEIFNCKSDIIDSLSWQEIGPPSPCLLLLHLQLLQEDHHVILGSHISILLHHTVLPIASNHLNGGDWLVPTGPLLPHVPFRCSRGEELDAGVPHHLRYKEFQPLFFRLWSKIWLVTSYSLQVGMFSSWAQSIAAIPITSLHPDIICMHVGHMAYGTFAAIWLWFWKKKLTVDISCKLLESWCKVYAVATPGKCMLVWFFTKNYRPTDDDTRRRV